MLNFVLLLHEIFSFFLKQKLESCQKRNEDFCSTWRFLLKAKDPSEVEIDNPSPERRRLTDDEEASKTC